MIYRVRDVLEIESYPSWNILELIYLLLYVQTSLVWSVALHSVKTLALLSCGVKRLEVFEMWLRRVERISRDKKVTNEILLQLVVVEQGCLLTVVTQKKWSGGQHYVPQFLCSPVPMFPGTYVPRYLCSPVHMFPGTDVPRFFVLSVVISINRSQICFPSTIAG